MSSCSNHNGRHRSSGFTLIEIMIVISILGIILAIATTTWMRQRQISRWRVCQENLMKINGAKDQWAMDNNKGESEVPTWDDLATDKDGQGSYLKFRPVCPAEGAYTLNPMSLMATCDVLLPYNHNTPNE